MNRSKIILLTVLILAAFLRFYRLDSYPALNADEAAIGYNAYSLIQTGKDEHGNSWPIHFQSFNDYKPGLYFYLVLPFVRFLGLNEWAVRIPGALIGVATVLVVYLLVNELFGNRGKARNLTQKYAEAIPLTSALFLAISPWHIHFSRGGWETNVATFLITTGVWLFLKALKNPKFFIHSSLFFVLSMYTYHAARAIVPVLGIGLLLIYRTKVAKNLKSVLIAGMVALVALSPLILDLTRGSTFSRAAGVGLFADPGPLNRINEQRGEHEDFRSLPAVIIHNKPINYSLAFLENWSEHFWGEFLFLSGDEIQRNKVPETGQMYLFDILFVLGGFFFIAKKPKEWRLILFWLIIAPFAAALTFQSPHALRAHNMVIPLVIISAYGLISILKWMGGNITSKNLLLTFNLGLLILIAWQLARYQRMYWLHMSKEYPYSSQYGVKELVAYVQEREDRYEEIIVTDRYDQPYILFLFYKKYPPGEFQLEQELSPRDKFGFSTVRNFDKYYFQEINFDEIRPSAPNSLIIGTDEEIPDEANIVKKIYFPNGNVAFEIVEN